MTTNPEWCLMDYGDECNSFVNLKIENIVSCKQCAYSLEYKLKNLSQDVKEYLELRND